MREIHAQSLVVKAIRERNGVAFKMSNRFLIGVSDLFVQIPGFPTNVWEAKMSKTKFDKSCITVDLSLKQEKFLRELFKAGGRCGVISFVQDNHDLWFAAGPGYSNVFEQAEYTLLTRGLREQRIYELLYKVNMEWK